jgi:hypothetical protein
MGEKKAAAAPAEGAPKKKRSIVKLAIFALIPILLAGGGYAGWTMFMAPPAGEHAAEGGEHGEGAPDDMHVAAVDYSVAAENSYSYTLALSVMLAEMCGTTDTEYLEMEADKEMQSDGKLVHLSWVAAHRRMGTLGPNSCDLMIAEIIRADGKAFQIAAAIAAAAKKDAGGGGH